MKRSGPTTRASSACLGTIAWMLVVCVAQAQPPKTATATPVPATPPTVSAAAAEEIVIGPWMPRSGDAWIDLQLADINLYGARYRGAFLDEIVRYHAAPRELVESLIDADGWLPGDVYYACALANVAGRPCRAAVALREASPGDGWETIGMDLGIDDQSAAAKRLRHSIKASYRHWARPEALRVADDPPGGNDARAADPAARAASREAR